MVTRGVACLLLVAGGVVSVASHTRVPVTVYITVADSQGRAITDLRTEEIEVVAGGRAVAAELSPAPPARGTHVVLIDGSGSMSFWPLVFPADLQAALTTALRAASAPPERLLIHGVSGPFGTAVLPADGDVGPIMDVLLQIRSTGREPSPIWDATIRSVEAAHGGISLPIAMLLVTDGRATGNRCSVNEATQVALQRGASVSVLALGGPTIITTNGKDRVLGDEVLTSGASLVDPGQITRQVSETTGGLFMPLSFLPLLQSPVLGRPGGLMAEARRRREMGVKVAADAVGGWLEHTRHRYRLQLELPAAGTVQPLSVTVRRPGAVVTAPKGYVTAAPGPPCATKTP